MSSNWGHFLRWKSGASCTGASSSATTLSVGGGGYFGGMLRRLSAAPGYSRNFPAWELSIFVHGEVLVKYSSCACLDSWWVYSITSRDTRRCRITRNNSTSFLNVYYQDHGFDADPSTHLSEDNAPIRIHFCRVVRRFLFFFLFC